MSTAVYVVVQLRTGAGKGREGEREGGRGRERGREGEGGRGSPGQHSLVFLAVSYPEINRIAWHSPLSVPMTGVLPIVVEKLKERLPIVVEKLKERRTHTPYPYP